MTHPVQGLKGGKFEMNRSQCPVAKILIFSPRAVKGGKFEIDRDGFKGAENSSVQNST
jgi:hypothetical protein